MRAEIITTGRLDLLPLAAEHADELAAALADPALYTFIGGAPDNPQVIRARYLRMVEGSHDPDVSWLNWVIRPRDGDQLAGTVQATVTPDSAEIAWVLATAWQGRGIASEAARALVGWLDAQRVPTIIAHIHPDHRASAAVAVAAGLTATDEWQDGEVRWRR